MDKEMKNIVLVLLIVSITLGVLVKSARAQSGNLSIIPWENENLYGMNTPAGSGRHLETPSTIIYKVTNLNDSGSGSLRDALENQPGPKTIIFEVSGNIELQSGIRIGGFTGNEAEAKGSYITIAGQTAPSPGITLKNYGITIERNCHDILIQHIRFRTGDDSIYDNYNDSWTNVAGTVYSHACSKIEARLENVWYNGIANELTENDGAGASVGSDEWDLDDGNDLLYVNVGEDPANGELVIGSDKAGMATPLGIDGHYRTSPEPAWDPAYNIVVDHCSIAWGGDMSFTSLGNYVTLSNSILSEGLNHPYHPKGPHSKGPQFDSDYGDTTSSQYVAVVKNILAHNVDRNPNFEGAWGIVVNNILYDNKWSMRTIDDDGHNVGKLLLSLVGNYQIETDLVSYAPYICAGLNAGSKVYISNDNYWSGAIQTDPWNSEDTTVFHQRISIGNVSSDVPEINRAATAEEALWPAGYTSMSAADARTHVLGNAGARPADRDAVDQRIINEVTAESGTSAIIECVACANSDCIGADDPFDCCTGAGTGTCPDQTWPSLAENHRTLNIPENYNEIQPSRYTKLEEWLHGYSALVEGDATPPTRSNPSPTGTLASGTTSTNISLETDKQAVCRYSNSSNTNYTEMEYNFTYTNSTNHSTLVTGLENGQTCIYYIRCNSTDGYVNDDDFNISFSIDGHKADLNDDGVIDMKELIAFIARWKASDGVTRQEVEEARDIWFTGGMY